MRLLMLITLLAGLLVVSGIGCSGDAEAGDKDNINKEATEGTAMNTALIGCLAAPPTTCFVIG